MRAVILAAGEGSRLRPFTNDRPKCMVEVGGREILDRALENLRRGGVSEAVIVAGYRAAQLEEAYGNARQGVALRWITNPIYASTNNLYSLWLAREAIRADHLLVESDLLFEPALIERLLASPFTNVAVVDDYRPELNGTILKADGDGRVEQMVLKTQQGPGYDHSDSLKTVNIYRFGEGFMRDHFLPRLETYVKEERTGVYYEAVLAELVAEDAFALGALRTGELKWAEVDTPEDRELAARDFPTTES